MGYKDMSCESVEWGDQQIISRKSIQEECQLKLENRCLFCIKTKAVVSGAIFPNQRFFENGAKETSGSSCLCKQCINCFLKLVDENRKESASTLGRKAAYALHSKPGGTYEKHAKLREIFASGKYSSRDVCAEQECAGLDMSFSAARRALRNTPDPRL